MKKHLLRDKKKGVLAGVCAGLGEYCNISPWIFRVLFVLPVLPFVFNFISGVVSIAFYIVLAFVIPDKLRIDEKEVVEVDYEIIDEAENTDETENAEESDETKNNNETKEFSDHAKEKGEH
ncbi:MAG: PspC domain-containing protein [Eubacteriaceae bacterium]|nr:PspC domain-containing protein [Eubacteriaceae bacterium]